jgi:hypothetical protein
MANKEPYFFGKVDKEFALFITFYSFTATAGC